MAVLHRELPSSYFEQSPFSKNGPANQAEEVTPANKKEHLTKAVLALTGVGLAAGVAGIATYYWWHHHQGPNINYELMLQ